MKRKCAEVFNDLLNFIFNLAYKLILIVEINKIEQNPKNISGFSPMSVFLCGIKQKIMRAKETNKYTALFLSHYSLL